MKITYEQWLAKKDLEYNYKGNFYKIVPLMVAGGVVRSFTVEDQNNNSRVIDMSTPEYGIIARILMK